MITTILGGRVVCADATVARVARHRTTTTTTAAAATATTAAMATATTAADQDDLAAVVGRAAGGRAAGRTEGLQAAIDLGLGGLLRHRSDHQAAHQGGDRNCHQ